MAIQIQRHYDLSTLTVTLHADDDPPAVGCELEFTRDHVPQTAGRWRMSTAAGCTAAGCAAAGAPAGNRVAPGRSSGASAYACALAGPGGARQRATAAATRAASAAAAPC